MRVPYLAPVRVLYVWGILIIGVIVIAIAWFASHYLLVEFVPVANEVAQNIGSNSSVYNSGNTFIENLDNWLPVVAFIALGVWSFMYSARRGEPVD